MKKLFAIFFIVLITACNDHNTSEVTQNEPNEVEGIIQVKDIAGKTEAQVSSILGKPLLTKDSEFFTKHYYIEMYKDFGKVEVLFIDGSAQHVTLHLFGDEYNRKDHSKNLAYIGLPSNVELAQNKIDGRELYLINDYEGFYEIGIEDLTEVGSIRVITEEKYK